MLTRNPVPILIASPLEAEHAERIAAAFPDRIEVIHRPDLMPPARYVADHDGGNKRLFVLDGEIAGAVVRRPDPGDFRIGPPCAAAAVVDADRRIVAALAPVLLQHGIALAGLDVIAGRLIEVNVTCPGGMAKTDALLGTDLSGAIVRRLLAARSAGPAVTPCPPIHLTPAGVT